MRKPSRNLTLADIDRAEILNPFFVSDYPTLADVREYLRHTNANYACDAIRSRQTNASD
jgi:hypothetical protein